jgi:hypothetical protein
MATFDIMLSVKEEDSLHSELHQQLTWKWEIYTCVVIVKISGMSHHNITLRIFLKVAEAMCKMLYLHAPQNARIHRFENMRVDKP